MKYGYFIGLCCFRHIEEGVSSFHKAQHFAPAQKNETQLKLWRTAKTPGRKRQSAIRYLKILQLIIIYICIYNYGCAIYNMSNLCCHLFPHKETCRWYLENHRQLPWSIKRIWTVCSFWFVYQLLFGNYTSYISVINVSNLLYHQYNRAQSNRQVNTIIYVSC